MDASSFRCGSCDIVVTGASIDGAAIVVDAGRDSRTFSYNAVVVGIGVDSTVISDAVVTPPSSDGIVAGASVDNAAVISDTVDTRCIGRSCDEVVTVAGVDSAVVVDAAIPQNDIGTDAGENSADVVDADSADTADTKDGVVIDAGAAADTGVDGAGVVDAVAATKTTTLDSVVAAAGVEGASAVEADAADTRSCRSSSSNDVVAR